MSVQTNPHDLDAERAVLGAVLVDNRALMVAARIVRPPDFFRDAHVRLFATMVAMSADQRAIDTITLKHALGTDGLERVGGQVYIAGLLDGLPRSSNVEHYAAIVKQHSERRRIIRCAQQIVDTCAKDPAAVANEEPARLLEALRCEIDAARNGTAIASKFITAAESCRNHDRVPILLDPYVVCGTIGSVVAKIKMGKTTLALEMVRCLRRGIAFCGFEAPDPCRVLYATEQPSASFNKQLQDAGLQRDEDGLIVTYLSSWLGQPWDRIAPAMIDHALRCDARVLVLDTGSRWFGFKADEENQAGAAERVQLLQPFTAKGGTVLILRHGRKSGGSAHDVARGSSAIDGAVDYILHLHRPNGQPADVREIECVGRFDMPQRMLIRRRANFETSSSLRIVDGGEVPPPYAYEVVGQQSDGPKVRIRAELTQGGKTAKQLAAAVGVSINTINRTLEDMPDEIVNLGKGGVRNNAAVYGLRPAEATTPSRSQRDGKLQSYNRNAA